MDNQLFRLLRKPPDGLFACLFFLFFCQMSNGQQLSPSVISANGGRIETATLTLDWTLGETFVGDSQVDGHRLTEGFHQPVLTVEIVAGPATTTAEKMPISKREPAQTATDRTALLTAETASEVDISIWPNPVCENLTVQISSPKMANVQLQLLDSQGRLLEQNDRQPTNSVFEISMDARPNGIYFLHFMETDGRLLGSRKITLAR